MCLGRTHGAPYRGYNYVPLRFGGGWVGRASLGEWEHNNILCVFIFQIILKVDFFSFKSYFSLNCCLSKDIDKPTTLPGRVAQSVWHLTRKSEFLGSIPGLAI